MTEPDPTPFPLDHLTRCGVRDSTALIVGDERLTYRQLDEAVGRLSSALLSRGLKPGDRVATWMGKTWLACIMPLAAARAGLVHVPINPVLKHAQAAHILADSGARLLVANQARLESLQSGDRADAEAVALEDWRDGGEALPPSSRDPAELAALFWHCIADRDVTREQVGEAVAEQGLAACARPLRTLLQQILQGQA